MASCGACTKGSVQRSVSQVRVTPTYRDVSVDIHAEVLSQRVPHALVASEATPATHRTRNASCGGVASRRDSNGGTVVVESLTPVRTSRTSRSAAQ
jgi:hypothetical protein